MTTTREHTAISGGPVLFEGEGAVGLIRFTLAPHLGGTPVPEGINPQEAKTFGGAFTNQVGLRVLAPILSIYDDPTAREGGGKALIGGYKIDDEGVLEGPQARLQRRDASAELGLRQAQRPPGRCEAAMFDHFGEVIQVVEVAAGIHRRSIP